jgi:D-sedoheptulose 7-phosphate isomerase
MLRQVRREITRLFADSIAVKRQFLRDNLDTLVETVEAITTALRAGHKLLLFGNGGSAADAQHIAAEFVNRFKLERAPLPALALTTDTSALTSIANDYGYAEVFAKQVRALGRAGDVALAISTSGNARNVLRGVAVCRRVGIRTIALTGGTGGKLAAAADLVLRAGATTDTARIQETHILVCHVICDQVDAQLFGDGSSTQGESHAAMRAGAVTAKAHAGTRKHGLRTPREER